LSFKNKNSFILKKTNMKKIIVAAIGLVTLATLNGQAVEQRLPVAEEISNRRTPFNLEEIKVRWKKAALENCTGVPCTTTGPGTGGSFTCGTSTVADIDGNTYNTVLIGTQCWTKSNLKVTKYNDGTAIPLDASGGSTGNGAGETWSTQPAGAYCILSNESSTGTNASNYGFLYNWYAATDPKKICPAGWHVPSEAEYFTLTTFASPNPGYKLKSTSSLWTGSTNGTDNFGFSMLPSYERGSTGIYYIGVGNQYAMIWTTTTVSTTNAKNVATYHSDNAPSFYSINKKNGDAIRCLKD
jgi:uncharacterized protein (TIGR02145 family)